ncbi:hypothetical protein BGZ65_002160 [Modicella reniformis]|uniref:F-box domain-containing protein n=1 Tax=Modicella reniformis TaxID=1440133 RepID=A0A9P6J175_9FUNG|nr:hypothetical protein BGZ65_002160 [Modicella reniformis]
MDIAEILQTVAKFLDPKSLVAASQVSRHWHRCCTPILWSTISKSDWVLPRFSPRHLHAQAHLVHSFEWHCAQNGTSHNSMVNMWGILNMIPPPPLVSPMLQPSLTSPLTPPSTPPHGLGFTTEILMKSNKTLSADGGKQEQRQEPPIQDKLSPICLSKIIGRCETLQRLCLHGEWEGIHCDTVQAIQSLVYLKSLELYADHVVIDQEGMRATRLMNVQDLIRDMPQLQTLTLRGTAFTFQSPSTATILLDLTTTTITGSIGDGEGSVFVHLSSFFVQSALIPSAEVAPNVNILPLLGEPSSLSSQSPPVAEISSFPIKYLSLDSAALTEEKLKLLLQQCPMLESLDLPGGLAWEWSDDFITQIASSCPHLSAFSINSSCHPPVPKERLTALVLALPPLRRFGARSCLFDESTLDALEERSPNLEQLDISLTNSHQLMFKSRLYEYLRHTSHLKHLEAEGLWISIPDLQQEHDNFMSLRLGASPHSSPSSPQTTGPLSFYGWASRNTLKHLTIGFSSPDRSTQRCNAMYRLLSTFTGLEHLHVSYTCMNFSPEYGFYQLETLKQLRTFNIETCAYMPLTQQDVVWMATTWPQLERIFINSVGTSKLGQFQEWLKEAQREDVVIKCQIPIF